MAKTALEHQPYLLKFLFLYGLHPTHNPLNNDYIYM